jgi:subtilase family serine protease
VQTAGGGFISNSWGGSESPDETHHDLHFQTPGIVYLASSGDSAAPAMYPSSSPFVISAGGTSIIRDHGQFIREDAWSLNPVRGDGSSGGPSLYEARPPYQNSVSKIVGTHRGTPDIAFDANPETGVDVYSTDYGGWFIVGGTSVASPALAGILNAANHRAASTADQLQYIYTQALKHYKQYWHDIIIGNNGYPTLSGYDFVTGLGSPNTYSGK